MRKKIVFLLPYLLLVFLIREAKSWMPPLEIDVVSITFDFESGYADDALYIRKNASTYIAKPEWLPPSRNNPLAYIKSQANRHIYVSFTHNQGAGEICFMLVKANGGGYYPGTIQETYVSFPSCGTTASAELTLTGGSTPGYVQKWGFSLYWYVTEVNDQPLNPNLSVGTTGSHLYYTLLAAPQAPVAEPWTDVLDLACTWASNKTYENQAIAAITTNAYNYFGQTKHYDGGGTHAGGTAFNLTSFFSNNWGDCQDMSAVVQVFTWMLGGSVARVRTIDDKNLYIEDFYYKSIKPFGQGWTQGVNRWNFHQVGWYNNVYDACIKVNYNNPRIPVDEDINGSYKTDLYYSGAWVPKNPFYFTTVY